MNTAHDVHVLRGPTGLGTAGLGTAAGRLHLGHADEGDARSAPADPQPGDHRRPQLLPDGTVVIDVHDYVTCENFTVTVHCPLYSGRHPREPELTRGHREWARGHDLFADGDDYERFCAARFDLLASAQRHRLSLQGALAVSHIMTWFFVFDDAEERHHATDPGSSEQWRAVRRHLDILAGDAPQAGDSKTLHAFADLLDLASELGDGRPDPWYQRLVVHLKGYLQGTWGEGLMAVPADFNTALHWQVRQLTGGVLPGCDLAASSQRLPAQFVTHDAIIDLLDQLCVNHNTWINDLLGLNRDQRHGLDNTIIVLRNEHAMPLEQAARHGGAALRPGAAGVSGDRTPAATPAWRRLARTGRHRRRLQRGVEELHARACGLVGRQRPLPVRCRPDAAGRPLTAAGIGHSRPLGGPTGLGTDTARIVAPRTAVDQPGDPYAPPRFPRTIGLSRRSFENWSGQVRVDDVWTCVPRCAEDIVVLANWAAREGWRLRPLGHSHTFSTLVITPDDERVVLVDTAELTALRVNHGTAPTVTAQTGVKLESLLTALREAGCGLAAVPASGDLSLGGMLAVGAHGTGVAAGDEVPVPGHGFGSLSGLVETLTAVVWDPDNSTYELRAFDRSQAECAALLVHLGRMFVTEATLRVGPDTCLRCESRCDIAADELFAPPPYAGPRGMAAWVERCGRVEALWWPFTSSPWVKLWSLATERPPASRSVARPYNYPFTDSISKESSDLLRQIVGGNSAFTPAYCNAEMATVVCGLAATASADIWGASMNVLLYVRPTTLRMTTNGYAILTSRGSLQRVVAEFYNQLKQAVAHYQSLGEFPMNGPLEVRVSGADERESQPQLSAVRSRPDRPGWDTAVWFDMLTLPGTPYANQFYREIEGWLFDRFDGEYAAVRPEWSKGWAYTIGRGACTDKTMVSSTIPASLRSGQRAGDDWDAARATYSALDPHRVFSSAFLDELLGGNAPP